MQRIVILGTGTDVGKTYVTCHLAELIAGQAAKLRVLALKPIETGVLDLSGTDAAKLGAASSPRLPAEHAYVFEPPISPHRAARISGTRIDVQHLVRWISERAERVHNIAGIRAIDDASDRILIETAGGVFSPINENQTNLDLACALEPSYWILVGVDRLGVLHDMRATLTSMQRFARLPDIILLNAPHAPDESTGTNRHELEALGWAQIAGQISRNGGLNASDRENVLRMLASQSDPNATNSAE
jgi:dethiobiotin synthetase